MRSVHHTVCTVCTVCTSFVDVITTTNLTDPLPKDSYSVIVLSLLQQLICINPPPFFVLLAPPLCPPPLKVIFNNHFVPEDRGTGRGTPAGLLVPGAAEGARMYGGTVCGRFEDTTMCFQVNRLYTVNRLCTGAPCVDALKTRLCVSR